MKFSYDLYNKLILDKIIHYSSEIYSFKRKYNFNYFPLITRMLRIHHGTMPSIDSFKIISRSKSLNDLFRYSKNSKNDFEININFSTYIKSFLSYIVLKSRAFLIPKNSVVIAIHQAKFINYINSSRLFDNIHIVWLVFEKIQFPAKNLNKDHFILCRKISFRLTKGIFPINYCDDTYKCLFLYISCIKPKALFTLEGDAPYQIQLSNVCKELGIKNFCFQWGLLHNYKSQTAFSNMSFTYFLSWGSFFSKQLKPLNPDQKFLDFGHLCLSSSRSKGDKILILDQGAEIPTIPKSHIEKYYNLITLLSNKYTGKLIFRQHPQCPLEPNIINGFKSSNIEISDSAKCVSVDLNRAKIAISIMSSSLLDAFVHGVIPVSFKYDHFEAYPLPLNELEIGFESNDIYELFKFISELMLSNTKYIKYKHNVVNKRKFIFSENTTEQRVSLLNDLIEV